MARTLLCPVCQQPTQAYDGAVFSLCPTCASAPKRDLTHPTTASQPPETGRSGPADTILAVPIHAGPGAAAGSAGTQTPGGATGGPPPETRGTPFGRYRLQRQLGAGAMGTVWKAWDTRLERTVALKQLREDMPAGSSAVTRFEREARLAARLDHPGIVRVYDVGQLIDRPYLTMDLVDGGTLAARLSQTRELRRGRTADAMRDLPEQIALLADVANAVAFAHERGVVHRDLKPGNVLIDAAGTPRVADFGLAREVAPPEGAPPAAPLTLTGQCLGTPLYMSPEQAAGIPADIGASCDVWALGVILYEMLTGTTPFETAGGPWAVLRAVQEDDPVRPRVRQPAAPAELEAVCLRALEKEPGERIDSAAHFHQELRRWLRGEPVLARPPGIGERLVRGLRRHRGAAVAAGVLVLIAAAFAWQRHEAEFARAESVRMKDEAQRTIRDYARLCVGETLAARREGNLSVGRRLHEKLMDACQSSTQLLGASNPEPDFLVGRCLRVMLQENRALQYQERALALDRGYAPAHYERVVLLAREHGRLRLLTRRAWLARQRTRVAPDGTRGMGAIKTLEPTDAELEKAEPRLLHLRQQVAEGVRTLTGLLASDSSWANHPIRLLAIGAPQRAMVGALDAAFADPPRSDQIETLLQDALVGDFPLEEARDLEIGIRLRNADYKGAIEKCTAALAKDRGYVHFWRTRALTREALAQLGEDGGANPLQQHESAVADISRAIDLVPEHAPSWRWRADAHREVARLRGRRPDDPRDPRAAALSDYNESLRLDPADPETALGRTLVWMDTAQAAFENGDDYGAPFQTAREELDKLLERLPKYAEAWCLRGMLFTNWALFRRERGRDYEAEETTAAESLDRALELDTEFRLVWVLQSIAWLNQSQAAIDRGTDPVVPTQRALATIERLIALDPRDPEGLFLRGMVTLNLGGWQLARGDAAAPETLDAAVRAFQAGLALQERRPDGWVGLALAHQERGLMLDQLGQDPTPAWRSAIEACDRAAASSAVPVDPRAYWARAAARYSLATRAGTAAAEVDAHFSAALADVKQAIGLQPRYADAWIQRGMTEAALAHRRVERGEEVGDAFSQAVEHLSHALEINPRSAFAWLNLSHARRNRASWYHQQGRNARAEALAAIEAACHAGEQRRGWADAHLACGLARLNLGLYESAEGRDPAESYRDAREDLLAATRANPRLAAAWRGAALARVNQAAGMMNLGRDPGEWFDAALTEANEAIRLAPADPEAWLTRGLAYGNQAIWLADHDQETAGAAFGAARTDFDRLLELDPDSVAGRQHRARTAFFQGQWEEDAGQDGLPSLRRALADREQLAQRFPTTSGFPESVQDSHRAIAQVLLRRGVAEIAVNRYQEARGPLEAALAEFDLIPDQPGDRPDRQTAHYDLACIFAMAAEGRAHPEALPMPPPAEQLAALRTAAFDHLRAAIKWGWEDAGHIETDHDLQSLRADPRWAELIGSLKQ